MSINICFENNTFLEPVTKNTSANELKSKVSIRFKMEKNDFLLKINNQLLHENEMLVENLFSKFQLANNIISFNIQINDITFDIIMNGLKSDERIHFAVESGITVGTLKKIISEKLEINLNNGNLKSSDKVFKDKMILKDIVEKKTVHVIRNEEFMVHVINDKRNYKIFAKRDQKISEFKRAISEKIGLPVDTFYLTFNGQIIENVLPRKFSLRSTTFFKNLFHLNMSHKPAKENPDGDSQMLESYEINKNSIVHVILRARGGTETLLSTDQ